MNARGRTSCTNLDAHITAGFDLQFIIALLFIDEECVACELAVSVSGACVLQGRHRRRRVRLQTTFWSRRRRQGLVLPTGIVGHCVMSP